MKNDAIATTAKNSHGKLLLGCHQDKNSSHRNPKLMNMANQEKEFIYNYIYYIDTQLIKINDSDSDIYMEESKKTFFCLTNKTFIDCLF